MNAVITPRVLKGSVAAPVSKSEAHRLLICAALADAPTRIALATSSRKLSEDIDATIHCLEALGAKISREENSGEQNFVAENSCEQNSGGENSHGQNSSVQNFDAQNSGEKNSRGQNSIGATPAMTLTVHPIQRETLLKQTAMPTLDCRESGSTLRFMLPIATALCGRVRFTGRGRLPARPIGELIDAMRPHGVAFSADRLPFETSGRMTGGQFALTGNVSSQYITGLLLAFPLLKGESVLSLTSPLRSAAYVDITLAALSRFGIRFEQMQNARGEAWRLVGPAALRSPGDIAVGGDWSGAAFFLAAGALCDSITVRGLDINSKQGDKRIVDFLKSFGAEVRVETAGETGGEKKRAAFPNGTAITVSPPADGILHAPADPIDIDATPDLLPILAVVAARANGTTSFVNGSRLRAKESDRLAASAEMIRALFADDKCAEITADDALIVHGDGGHKIGGADTADEIKINGAGDHRMVMAAAVAATRASCRSVVITDAEAVSKSYPAFFDDYKKLGGEAHVV